MASLQYLALRLDPLEHMAASTRQSALRDWPGLQCLLESPLTQSHVLARRTKEPQHVQDPAADPRHISPMRDHPLRAIRTSSIG